MTVSCSAWTDHQDYCPCRPRSRSIEHKVRIRGIYHALGRCSLRLAWTRLLAKFRMEFRFTDEAKVSAEFAREPAKGSRTRMDRPRGQDGRRERIRDLTRAASGGRLWLRRDEQRSSRQAGLEAGIERSAADDRA
jgi:hypothetical protein